MGEARLKAVDLPPGTLAAFAALRERFSSGLADRWQEIERLHGETHALSQALHRLAGAAGSFGFEDLSRAARAAEMACGSVPAEDWGSAHRALHAQVLAAVPVSHRGLVSPLREAPDTMS
jgi:hypothetical protein